MSAGNIARHFNVTGDSVDVRVLKDILGHEQLNTTQIYTHISDANMEHAMDMNPLANRRSGNGAPAAETQPLDDDASEE